MLSGKTNLRLLVIVCVAGLTLGLADVAWANNGPHGNYSVVTDACAGCHRVHRGAGDKMLISASVASVCLSCHGSGGTGADTNVEDGVYAGGGDLLGGGFVSYQGAGATSAHSIDGSWVNAWGSGTTWSSTTDCAGCHNPESGLVWPGAPLWGISPNAWPTFPGRGQNVTMPLTCASCHNPHGGRNYRMLQRRMHPPDLQQEDPSGYVLVTSHETGGCRPDQTGYVPDYTTQNYRLGLGDWCTGCHFTYHQEVSVQPFNAEDELGLVTRYRHKMNIPPEYPPGTPLTTNLPLEKLPDCVDPAVPAQRTDDQLFCLSCHYAHGSNASMTGLAANLPPTNDSSLLRLDNRGVCVDCHF